MLKVAVKGLATRRLRAVLTALAIVLGVAQNFENRFLARLQQIDGILAVVDEQLVHVARQSKAVGLLDLGARPHLRN